MYQHQPDQSNSHGPGVPFQGLPQVTGPSPAGYTVGTSRSPMTSPPHQPMPPTNNFGSGPGPARGPSLMGSGMPPGHPSGQPQLVGGQAQGPPASAPYPPSNGQHPNPNQFQMPGYPQPPMGGQQNGVAEDLSHTMQSLHISQPSPMSHDAMAPARTKRTARAYHADGSSSSIPQSRHEQAPIHHPYENAPPPGPDPRQQHPVRPTYEGPPAQSQPTIEQPPHSMGQRLQGLRSKIDPNQIPSPVSVQLQDQARFDEDPFLTCSRATVPLSTTDYLAVDEGNATPRFIRMTTYALPHSDDLAVASQIPFGLVVQPFAEVAGSETPVPVVDFGESGPPRCKQCRGYVNPWCPFIDGGQKFVCNLCGASTAVETHYFAHLDTSGRRVDLEQRPELTKGSVDFIVPKEYWASNPKPRPVAQAAAAVSGQPPTTSSMDPTPRDPAPMTYVFAIDVSWQSAQSGVISEVAGGIKDVLYGEGSESLPLGSKVAILTFDRTVHFYSFKPGLDQAQMLVVADLDDMFVPMPEGILVDVQESKSLITAFLDAVQGYFASTQTIEAAIGGPLKAAVALLCASGGQFNIFQGSLPTAGPGSLKHREDSKLYNTDKERSLFMPQDPWYREIAEECSEAGIGVNLFLFPSQYIDVASLGVVAGLTGGELFFHPRFQPVREGLKVRSEINRVVTRPMGFNATMRIRCSNGLHVADHFGNFFQRNVTDLEFGTLDADKAIGALIKHEGKLDEKSDAYVQCAVLYTSAQGERRVRVHNIAISISSKLGDVFRLADMDTTIALVAKEAITQTLSKTLREVRDHLTDTCVKVLLAYRKHCAAATSPGQLILPESYKLFPIFALSLMKTKALKGGNVASDVRTFYMRVIKSIGVGPIVELLYPRMYPVHILEADHAMPGPDGRLKQPQLMRTSYARMDPNGVYLIENGQTAIIWLGHAVSPQILLDIYGVDNLEELDSRMTSLPKLPTLLSQQLRNLVAYLGGNRHLPVVIARQNMDGTEYEFSSMLVEDSHSEALSYVDYLCAMHKRIQESLSGEKREADDAAASSLWRGAW